MFVLAKALDTHLDNENNRTEMGWDADTMTSWFIDHADAIRDALAPFDSGVREET